MKPVNDGPIVENVRRVRREILRGFGYDLDKYLAYLQKRERASGRRFRSSRRERAKRAGLA
jgi:hypothetical protein